MQNSVIKVSVIVPVYNVEPFLPHCVESIINQKEQYWELILIDDGSTDCSPRICDDYAHKDSRIRVVHKQNGGPSTARNLGIKMAKGERICFVDSDDWVEENHLSSMLKYADSDTTIVYGGVVRDYVGEGVTKPCFNYIEGAFAEDEALSSFIVKYRIFNNGLSSSKMFSRKLIMENNIRFNEGISFHEDHVFALRHLMYVRKIILSAENSYHYVCRGENNTLSSKRHPSSKLIVASDELISIVDNLMSHYNIKDCSYRNDIYTHLGLAQLVRSLMYYDDFSYGKVCAKIRCRKRYFITFYRPTKKMAWGLVLLVFFKCEYIIKFFLKHIEEWK